jgi:hypothetical protein
MKPKKESPKRPEYISQKPQEDNKDSTKRKLPFWIKKKYLPKSPSTKTTEEEKPGRRKSIFRNTPFRDTDPGMMS